MANFIQLSISVILVFTIVFLVNVNSIPTNTNATADSVVLPVEIIVVKNDYPCFNETDCNYHGQCRLNGTGCDCTRGWTTPRNADGTSRYCAYPQRSKQTAFFLSLFVGVFGFDWFYLSRMNLGYIIAGIFKLLMGCGCCGSWPLTYFGPELRNSESVKSKLRGVRTCFSLLAFVWWIVDWVRVLSNRFPDGNATGLIPW